MSKETSKVQAFSSSNEHVDAKVVAEKEIGDNLPPGYYFLPSASQLIQQYLLQRILGLPMASDIVKIRDHVEHLDPDQLNLDEFRYCKDNEGYYITKKAERKTDEETTIKTTTGHWKESKSNFDIFEKGQIVGCKNTFIFFQTDGKETAWRLNEYTAIPDIVPVDALTDTIRAKIEEYVACRIRFKQVKLLEQIIYEEEIEKDGDEDVEE
ncbi:NAC domain-containing protein [Heracleum sosnowskyi]|uniref:NAC domain-containing protein n=1 Tax=Heracleum sosnowskyi TaxID=360622 RepID=A0AAD8GT02_9APIA|nr:NAC domain-containing protein [Heracleum sosnowskyi]